MPLEWSFFLGTAPYCIVYSPFGFGQTMDGGGDSPGDGAGIAAEHAPSSGGLASKLLSTRDLCRRHHRLFTCIHAWVSGKPTETVTANCGCSLRSMMRIFTKGAPRYDVCIEGVGGGIEKRT